MVASLVGSDWNLCWMNAGSSWTDKNLNFVEVVFVDVETRAHREK
jgi:hypothetical protein